MNKWQLLVLTSSRFNILPLTSTCNLRCIFCSHHQNPPGVEAIFISPLSLKEIEELFGYLDPARPIVIGESATRIVEGEPLTHPEFFTIMRSLRRRFPHTLVEITTNGVLLDKPQVEALKGLKPIEVKISLNSVTSGGRQKLLGAGGAAGILKAIEELTRGGIPCHGSIVAYPKVVGWDDLEKTIYALVQAGALTVRIFIPGFTHRAPAILRFDPWGFRQELESFLENFRQEVKIPIIVEPPFLRDLIPEVAGVLPGYPAEGSGLKRGDVLLEIDGQVPRSRVEAFRLLSRPGRHKLKVRRPGQELREAGRELEILLEVPLGGKSGVVMEWDGDPEVLKAIHRSCLRHQARKAVVFTSELAHRVMEGMVSALPGVAKVIPVRNRFFGGSIACAGLLTVEDFLASWEELRKKGEDPDLLLLPGRAFDFRGRDLVERHYTELAQVSGLPVEIL
ncbi:Radical SAM superfamily enzyme, MoaA/NifB/PqqE/SkfB family [Thermanaeromonas toyohensis ToBE]|uniref:Radical SAM superfamily enzyme, MoaA/NifB/PqqE/SkfB family n=1 Tax=Thermanaeromonas toyohensis ToBE TaxID=698762 RepID=A0A1W1VCD4_9FIRM|nr:DUF512 domain-containing protein [Thermanaeromonas toyohensis]SMB91069.1 Radical SAM superfamily enzyme, MoaA/NifB/PqqE/SkfB family [Thermanaeromonas toyohensis ToBE]